MKHCINFVILAFVVSILNATEFSEEQIRMFLPFLKSYVPPPPCPPNEMYNTCTGNCSDCDQRGKCIVTKCISTCDCMVRFYRITPDGPCEPVANCPKPDCGENEVFRECGPIWETCTNFECRIINCNHKCHCKTGFLRNKDGVCIPKEECPIRTRCYRTEEWAESGPVDEYCPFGLNATVNNKTQDIARCYCKEGFKRNFYGHCINETLCERLTCSGTYSNTQEVYHKCVPKCNTTCRNYGDLNCTEDDNCYPGCFCEPGYVMNDFRRCIPIENCSLDIFQLKEITEAEDEEVNTDTTQSIVLTTTVTEAITDNSPLTEITPEIYSENITTSEKTTMTTSQNVYTTIVPTTATTVTEPTAKEKSQKKIKVKEHEEVKHENVAKEKEVSKYEFSDDDGFDNEDF